MSNSYALSHKALPHDYPFLLIDRVLDIEEGKSATCLKNISIGETYPGWCLNEDGLFPRILLVESMAQTSGLVMAQESPKGGFLSSIRDVKFHRPVRTGDEIIIKSVLLHRMPPLFAFEARVSVNDELVAEAMLTLAMV